MFKKLLRFREEYAFVGEVSSEITKLCLESGKWFSFAADERTFALAAQLLTRTIAEGTIPPHWQAAPRRALAWTLVDEAICDIGVGDDSSRLVSEAFYRFFDNEKRKDVESTCGLKARWGLHMI
jgi:hypothetical protein